MKINILLLIYLLLGYTTFSQSTFTYTYSSPLHELSRSMIEDEIGNLYFSIENHQYGLILKIDGEGSFLDSIRLENPNGKCTLAELISIDNNYFIALGSWTTDTISELWYVKFDNNLQVIEDKKINSNSWFIFEFHHIINHNGNIVIIAHYQTAPQEEFDVCMYEISLEGNVVRNRFFDAATTYNHAYTLLENDYNHTYKVFTISPLNPTQSRTPCKINIVDTNFNFIDSSPINYPNIENNSCAKWLNDSVYFLAGKWLIWEPVEWNVGIVKVTRNDSVLSSNSFGSPDTVDNPGAYHCLDFLSPNNLFLGWTSNLYLYPFQYEPSRIMLNILDSNLNLKNQTIFGGDAFYIVNSVLATHDSGCVLSCSRFDWQIQNNEYDVYILKVNKDGLLVNTPENSLSKTGDCTLYPNPGNEMMNIDTPYNHLDVQFFDLTGRMIRERHLHTGNNYIQVADLLSGIYLYRITDRLGHVVQSGKWIKHH